MVYEAELRFLRSLFRKCRIQTHLLNPGEPIPPQVDLGFWKLISGQEQINLSLLELMGEIKSYTIYKVKDGFSCSYLILQLPRTKDGSVLLIGPYLPQPMNWERFLEVAEMRGMDPKLTKELEEYYSSIPCLSEDSHLFAALDTFAECIWGSGERFHVVDMEQDLLSIPQLPVWNAPDENGDSAWNIQMAENIYSYENEIMKAVSQGQAHKADILFTGFSGATFKRRLTDPVRNLKNYCIIMNTLLRKAAENGGVHPIYLDRLSSDFARKIESLTTTEAAQEFMSGMFRSYCRLVKTHSMRRYSPPIQRTVTYIDYDLTADLSLHTLASMQNVSPSYFSALFKQETGQTLTDHVNQKRVNYAMQLLSSTVLQVQTVAQYSGFADMNYFSKVFKKYTGKTPSEYRKESKEQ